MGGHRQAFLTGLSLIYLIAYTSYYLQYPGLNGKDGLLPAHSYLESIRAGMGATPSSSPIELFKKQPLLSWFVPALNQALPEDVETSWDADLLHDAISLVGIVLSLSALVLRTQHGLVFVALYLGYLTLYQVGQEFYSFQWDILLLEVGFISIFYADWTTVVPSFSRSTGKPPLAWTLRYVLFKLMYMSGVVKIEAQCPTWLNLTALEFHFATQCLPTPLSWWAHQVHPLLNRAGVAATFLIQFPGPFLLLSPFLAHRRLGAALQVLLQVLIMLSGNYNFFNIITIFLCIPVWGSDDPALEGDWYYRKTKAPANMALLRSMDYHGPLGWAVDKLWWLERQWWWNLLHVVTGIVYLSWCARYLIVVDRKEGTLPDWEHINLRYAWTVEQTRDFVGRTLPSALAVFFALVVFFCLAHLHDKGSRSALGAARAMISSLIGLALIAVCTVPFLQLEPNLRAQLPPLFIDWYSKTTKWHITSGYGLFRRMTGVGPPDGKSVGWAGQSPSLVARPEIILEGLDEKTDQWREINFRYKPGSIHKKPKFVAPYQPRLDWQMWFAALGVYQHYPWIIHLADKILSNSMPVISLLDMSTYPFREHDRHTGQVRLIAPVAVRAHKYYYDFTRTDTPWSRRLAGAVIVGRNSTQWWRREEGKVEEYFPAFRQDNPSVQQFLEHFGFKKPQQQAINDTTTTSSSSSVETGGDSCDALGTCTLTPPPALSSGSLLTLFSSTSLRMVLASRHLERSIDLLTYKYRALMTVLWLVMMEWITRQIWRRARSRSIDSSRSSSKEVEAEQGHATVTPPP